MVDLPVWLESKPDGLRLLVTAKPGARVNQIHGEQAGRLKVSVTAVAEDGRANQAVLQLLADRLDLRLSQMRLLSGATSRQKVIALSGIDAAVAFAKLIETAAPADE